MTMQAKDSAQPCRPASHECNCAWLALCFVCWWWMKCDLSLGLCSIVTSSPILTDPSPRLLLVAPPSFCTRIKCNAVVLSAA
jgi:hypothetical protein